jgi:hypothetical protein
MRTKLFLGLACAALVVAIGAAWASSVNPVESKQPETAVVPATVAASEQPAKPACCCAPKTASASVGLLYCPLTDTVNADCCCKVVDGKWVCQITGTVSDECCCIPLGDGK